MGVLTTLDFHDEVRDVDERIHEREEDTHRRMDVLTTLDFHDFRRTSAKANISSDFMNRSLSTGKKGSSSLPPMRQSLANALNESASDAASALLKDKLHHTQSSL